MSVPVAAADEYGFPAAPMRVANRLADVGRNVAQRHSAPPAVRAVRSAAVDKPPIVERDFARFQYKIDGSALLLF